MSTLTKCDFCLKEMKHMQRYKNFSIRHSKFDEPFEIDVCIPCYKKFIKSIRTEVIKDYLEEDLKD